MSYTLNNIPEGTTHVWTYALGQEWGLGYEPLAFYRKTYYKKGGKRLWKVYSRHTGWRLSMNPPEWYIAEKEAGFFVTLKRAL